MFSTRMTRRQLAAVAAVTGSATFLSPHDQAVAATPADAFRVPGEWEPHSGCFMAWPWSKEIWGGQLSGMQSDIAGVARAVARFEPVIMAAEPGTADEARRQTGGAVTVVEMPLDDCWTRDSGPVFTVNSARTKRSGLDFIFNGWGNKFPHDRDDVLPSSVCQYLNTPRVPVNLVSEGGAVITDGDGTIITTAEVMLNPNRNPDLTKAQIESALLAAYGASKLIWLPYGLDKDVITDGHVDMVAAFLAPGKLLLRTEPGSGTPNEARMAANKEVLQSTTDARGRSFQLVEMTQHPAFQVYGQDVASFSYINYYLANGGVVAPLANTPEDAVFLAQLRALYPDREVVGTPARFLASGGGGVHCVTQNIPRLR